MYSWRRSAIFMGIYEMASRYSTCARERPRAAAHVLSAADLHQRMHAKQPMVQHQQGGISGEAEQNFPGADLGDF